MKLISVLLVIFAVSFAHAEQKMKMYFNNEEITKVIELYSKASGQKFIIDPGVRGKISIFNQSEVSLEEAFNQLSSALALNSFGISKQGDTMVVRAARNLQRDTIEVSPERPSLKPERMYTWIYTAKNASVAQINRDIRILVSRDGELNINIPQNQIIFTDWTSSLNRVAELMKELDKKADPEIAKIVGSAVKNAPKTIKAEKAGKIIKDAETLPGTTFEPSN